MYTAASSASDFQDFDELSQNPTHDQDDSDRCYGPIYITKQHCHASRRSFYYGQADEAFNEAFRITLALSNKRLGCDSHVTLERCALH
jgi:hypothetical protein